MVEFVIADPHAAVFESGGRAWLAAGSDPVLFERTVKREAPRGTGTDGILRVLAGLGEEGTFAVAERSPGGGSRVTLLKTLSSTFDLYFRRDGLKTRIFDHFRNAVASIPVADRVPDEAAFADHILFAYDYLPGRHTFLRGVSKLTPGSRVEIEPDGRVRFSQAEPLRLPDAGSFRQPEEAADRLGEILSGLVSAYGASFGAPAVLFSGGVDSTLVMACLEKGATAVTLGIDSPEYAFEMDYARRAGELLGAAHSLEILEEGRFGGVLRELVETLGQPAGTLFFQPMAFHLAFQGSHALFFSGEMADSLFGFNKLAKVFDDGALSGEERKALQREPWSLAGFAARSGLGPDLETVAGILGRERVESRLSNRLDFALALCPGLAGLEPARWREGHGELLGLFTGFGHAREYVGRTRQQAFCRGKTVMAPFAAKSVLDLALSMPMPGRIVREGVVKHIPKALLGALLPGYPVHTRKGGSDVPRTRFLQEGPLKGVFRTVKPPRSWPKDRLDVLLEPRRETSFVALSALSYSLWQDRVLENPGLEPVQGTRRLRFPPGKEGQA